MPLWVKCIRDAGNEARQGSLLAKVSKELKIGQWESRRGIMHASGRENEQKHAPESLSIPQRAHRESVSGREKAGGRAARCMWDRHKQMGGERPAGKRVKIPTWNILQLRLTIQFPSFGEVWFSNTQRSEEISLMKVIDAVTKQQLTWLNRIKSLTIVYIETIVAPSIWNSDCFSGHLLQLLRICISIVLLTLLLFLHKETKNGDNIAIFNVREMNSYLNSWHLCRPGPSRLSPSHRM